MTDLPDDVLRSFYRHAPLAAAVLDGDGVIVSANAAAERLFAVSAGGMAGRAIDELLEEGQGWAQVQTYPVSPETVSAESGAAVRFRTPGGRTLDGVTTVIRPGGEEPPRHTLLTISEVPPAGWSATTGSGDVAVREALDAASLGTWHLDIPNDRIFVRGSIVSDLFEDDTEVDMPIDLWFDLIHPEDLRNVGEANLALLRGERETTDVACRARVRTGEWRWHRVTGRITERDADGQAVAARGVVWNVDAARRLDDALHVQRQRYEHIYRATPAMMHTINATGHIVEVSDYWLESFGYERDEVIGRRSIDFLDAPSRKHAVEVSLPELFEHGRNIGVPYCFMHKDGHGIEVLLSSFLERDNDGEPLFSYAVMTDVTALRELNEQLQRSNLELDRFATVASHDLQEPLRKISAFASLVLRRYGDKLDADGVNSLKFLADAAQRMQRLVDDLLAYSKLANQKLDIVRLDSADILAKIEDNLDTVIAESGATIRATDLPELDADATLLTQILQNLVSNAVKYRAKAPPEILVGARRDGQEWVFWVKDNGIGFDMRFAEKVFGPFQRLHTREAYRGTGIGLAIVRQAVERQGGRVWVESAPRAGSTFYFSLPAARRGDRP